MVFCQTFPSISLRLDSRRTFGRLFSAGVLERPFPRCLHSLTVARFALARCDSLGDHVLTCKQHTGSIRGHNHLRDMVASLSRDSKIGPVRVNHAAVPIPAVASASVLHAAAIGGSVVGVVGPL